MKYKRTYEEKRMDGWIQQHIFIHSFDEFRQMLSRADYKCEICGTSLRIETATLDHNHITHMPRGVLCSMCNSSLYWFEKARRGYLMSEYPEQSERYLQKYGSQFN